MQMIHQIKTIAQFYTLSELPQPAHPLISVIDVAAVATAQQITSGNVVFGFYVISFKNAPKSPQKANRKAENFSGGILGFRAPGRVVKVEEGRSFNPPTAGWMLCIHPDFLWNTTLAPKMRHYDFFYYDAKEALFLSEEEQTTINTIVAGIALEFKKATDAFSEKIAIALIDALLTYIERFYQRQFNTNKIANHQLLDRLNKLLDKHFDENKSANVGLPGVAGLAEALNISPHYLSALLRSLTGMNAQQHIHEKLISKAKELLSTTTLSISEIAYTLGFEHLQSFSKLFKTKTQMSPLQFRRTFDQ